MRRHGLRHRATTRRGQAQLCRRCAGRRRRRAALRAGTVAQRRVALYGGGNFRLRMLTSGFHSDRDHRAHPDAYERHFRIHATAEDGSTVLLSETGVDYEVAGGTLRVLGLADLGQPLGDGVVYNDCYTEDVDNQIDIILEGNDAAARSITHVEVPSSGEYQPLYNPGGPGPEPFPECATPAEPT
ncbi:MAG: hypothetical protein CM15mP49_05760 [Actinomycetota bacterium]|nr:MAG: hypothetical protein CM15mP49_05760 [Actinomycetota bacterium]